MRKTFALGLASLLWLGCAGHPPAVLYGKSEQFKPGDFPRVLETWTRSDRLYAGIENKLFLSATYHSPALRRAFAVAFPDIYGHGGEVTKRELVELTGDVEQFHTFFVTMYTPNTKWNDLAQDDSIWRVTLAGSDEVVVKPKEIVPVKIDANLQRVYSHIGRFDKAYLVRFALTDPLQAIVIGPKTRSFTLRAASALGAAELVWQLQPL